jgi:hypothetical protein
MKDTALLEQGGGMAWQMWINGTVWQGHGTVTVCYVWTGLTWAMSVSVLYTTSCCLSSFNSCLFHNHHWRYSSYLISSPEGKFTSMLTFTFSSTLYETIIHLRKAKWNTTSEQACVLEFYRLFQPQNSITLTALCLQQLLWKMKHS